MPFKTSTRCALIMSVPAAVLLLGTVSMAAYAGTWPSQGGVTGDRRSDPSIEIIKSFAGYLQKQQTISVRVSKQQRPVDLDGDNPQQGQYQLVFHRGEGLHVDFQDDEYGQGTIDANAVHSKSNSTRFTKGSTATLVSTIDLNVLVEKLCQSIRTPETFSDLFTGGSPNGQYLGLETVQGVSCHHIKVTGESGPCELWIEDGITPLLRKVAFSTSRLLNGQTNRFAYQLEFQDWDFTSLRTS